MRHPTMRLSLCGLGLVLMSASSLSAQGFPPSGSGAGSSRGGAPRITEAQRLEYERRLQDRINEAVRKRLALTDDQFEKLRVVATRVEEERRSLRHDEMGARFAMRRELLAGERANESTVAELLDRMPRFERRRLELMEQEQRELAKFLSPTQRARYIGLQDELRRSMQDVQRKRMGMEGDSRDSTNSMRSKRPPSNLR